MVSSGCLMKTLIGMMGPDAKAELALCLLSLLFLLATVWEDGGR